MKILALASLCSALTIALAADPLLISAFNVQIFGKSKMQENDVVDILVQIIQRYDLIIIQEIRDIDNVAFPELVDLVNDASGNQYSSAISPRTGRSSSKEQYGYIYKTSKLQILDQFEYPDDENGDIFERNPYIITFKNLDSGAAQKVFNTIVLHSKPDDAVAEVSALADVYYNVASYDSIQDAIILGDLNADCNYITSNEWDQVKLCTDTTFTWKIPNSADTTVSPNTNCAYDRIVTAGTVTANSDDAAVFNYETYYGLTGDEAADVSDHYPVEFALY